MDTIGITLADFRPILPEMALFASVGLAAGAVDDIAADLAWLWHYPRIRRLQAMLSRRFLHDPARPLRYAVLVPAWREAGVIGAMIDASRISYAGSDAMLFVGCYPNDPATIAEVRARTGPKVRLVVGSEEGPTTKAHCLNQLWRTVVEELAAGVTFDAVIIHDAEDLPDCNETRLFDIALADHAAAQLPVIPVRHPDSVWLSGHYCDEFAESHGKSLPMRHFLGASVPFAGVGCALRTEAVAALAQINGGSPFEPGSLTEDYEAGLRLSGQGLRPFFIPLVKDGDGRWIGTRAHFPETFAGAVRQKARWINGIAIFGWDRLGWGTSMAEAWMRWRDRRAPFDALFIAAAYGSLAVWLMLMLAHALPPPLPEGALAMLLALNGAAMGWRLIVRFAFTGSVHGCREALVSVPRAAVGNVVAVAAFAWAAIDYERMRRKGRLHWSKTEHRYIGT